MRVVRKIKSKKLSLDIYNMDFSDLITEEIDERFCYIKYDEFDLIMMKENSYINATKLCKLGNKEFHKWKRLDGSKELIKELENVNKTWKLDKNSSTSDLRRIIIEVKTEGKHKYEVAGSYVHQDLIPHICSWISPSFTRKIKPILNLLKNKRELEKYDKFLDIFQFIKSKKYQLKLGKWFKDIWIPLFDQKI